jgi:predicted ferric reductase
MLLHSGLFVSAVSSRAGHVAWHLLVPDFTRGYYTSAVSLGVLALFIALIAVCAGVFRKHFSSAWRKGHALVFLVIVLVFFHAYQIGSELQAALFQPVFWLAVGSFSVVAGLQFFKGIVAKRE